VAACSSERNNSTVAQGDEIISCAVDGVKEYKPVCAAERDRQGDTLFLVVHHPNGAFRRFEVLKDGRGLATADGADTAQTGISSAMLEVTVDNDRYRFPATVKSVEGSGSDGQHE
jgi:hypothetical protein